MDIFSGFAAEGEEETYLYPTMQTDGVNTATSRQQVRNLCMQIPFLSLNISVSPHLCFFLLYLCIPLYRLDNISTPLSIG